MTTDDQIEARPSAGPARGYSWPPFAPGNTASLQAGHRSPRVYGEVARELASGMLADRPDLARYPEALARWSEWEARALLLRRHLAEVGDLDENGKPRTNLLKWLSSCENNAERAGALLGLDPISEARLSRDRAATAHLAVDLQAIAERGRQAVEGHEPASLPPVEGDPTSVALARVAAAGADAVSQVDQ